MSKGLSAAFLSIVGLCFVPVSGYGEVEKWMDKVKTSHMDLRLLEARVHYVMRNPTNFLNVSFHYDLVGILGGTLELPEAVNTKDKIIVLVYDNRNMFYHKSTIALLDIFKKTWSLYILL